MANVTGAQERAVRLAIKALIVQNETIKNVFESRKFIRSRQDFFERLGRRGPDNKTEIRFAEIRFIGWSDGDEGFEKTPEVILKYQIHLFFQFADRGDDVPNSDDEFAAALLDLRDRFLLTEAFAGGKGRQGLTDDGALIQFGPDTFTDADGHFIDLRFDVSHKATC